MALVLTADANPGTATWVDESTLAGGLSSVQTRIQVADLGSGTTTGTVLFGDSIPAETVVLGGFLRLNADPAVAGGSTISAINVTLGAQTYNVFTTLDVFGETGAPKYLTPFSNALDFSGLPLLSTTSGQAGYVVTVTGPGADLDQITAFDITIGVLVSKTLTVP